MPQPDLTFFCELNIAELESLFSSAALINKLRLLNANISMGMQDFSSPRAEIVKKLTRSGIPVTAWLLLPKDEGYWTNLDTVSATARVYGQFLRWTVENDLQWAAIGLDIEPSIQRMELLSPKWNTQVFDTLKRLFRGSFYRKAHADLNALVNLIRSDGYPVETYNFPIVVEERKASSEILARALGTPALDADREVLMLYSSFFDQNGDAILKSYARDSQGIGLGSTGGGVELEDGQPLSSMRWIDLRRDLLIAKEYSDHIYIFSLEGCVEKEFLDRLLEFDWSATVKVAPRDLRKINVIRKLGQGLLWALSHPEPILVLSFLMILFARKRGRE
jgi:hypothetical protein